MKKFLWLFAVVALSACAQDPYHLKIENTMADAHGQSVYYRSSLRSNYAGQIRRVLSNKMGEIGLKTATSAEIADYIGIFDIETFYAQSGEKFNPDAFKQTNENAYLFSDDESSESMYFSGNANVVVDHDKTCFTLKIGPKGTSVVRYSSSFCADGVLDTEEMLPLVLDIYGKYANYQQADVGVQCRTNEAGDVSCDAMYDRQKAFMNSWWMDKDIVD